MYIFFITVYCCWSDQNNSIIPLINLASFTFLDSEVMFIIIIHTFSVALFPAERAQRFFFFFFSSFFF